MARSNNCSAAGSVAHQVTRAHLGVAEDLAAAETRELHFTRHVDPGTNRCR